MWELKMVGLILLMMTMEVMDVTCNTIGKVAMAKGLSSYIFTTYIHGIAIFFLIPFAFLFHRNNPVPPINISMIFRLFLLGAVCGGCSMLSFVGIRYSSPTLASAMNNLSPALTFLLGILFRMENLNLRARSSLLKIVGTFVSITGAFIVTFYQGLPIKLFSTAPSELFHSLLRGTGEPNWVLGGLSLFTSCVFFSIFLIIKTWIAREFRSDVLITLISFFFETLVAGFVAFLVEEDKSVWTPSLEIIWIALLYGGFQVGIVNTVQTWACGKKGPLFVAMFKPLQMIIAVILGVSFLRDVLHLGSVIGGTIIGIGFYTVMKGKAEEEMKKGGGETNDEYAVVRNSEEDASPYEVPLLQNRDIDA
ncbi:WAT1-related protein At3g28050-like [Silene latifolia]|uniref:WAT1-related protein At3g28050-like n=1 Tax=Silene latifolia TaxID=37657 RepID=UPI003D76A5E0